MSEWCNSAGGSAVSGSADQVPEWQYGAGGPTVPGAAGDRYMLGRQHRRRSLEMPAANSFVAAFPIPVDERARCGARLTR